MPYFTRFENFVILFFFLKEIGYNKKNIGKG